MKREIETKELDLTLKSVHKKMMERGLLKQKDFIHVLTLVLVLFLSSTGLYAQDRSIDEIVTEMLQTNAASATQSTVVPPPVTNLSSTVPQEIESFDTYIFPEDYFPRFAIKTNLLYGATTTPNLGIEFFLSRFLTLDISGGWNPFVHRDNVKFAHWMVQPTLRYWIQEPFNGHFFGLSLMYSNFNVSGVRQPYEWFSLFPRLGRGGDDGYRFRGNAFSASLQYGHQWVLSPRWAIEASINVGYMLLDYQMWSGGWCGERIGNDRRHYFGPTNAGITLIYIIR